MADHSSDPLDSFPWSDSHAPLDPASGPDSLDALLAAADLLPAAELDGLPVGIIQLDGYGRILRFNATEARLAELPQCRQIGRMFFTEVAPCTRVQAFYGRFLDGVRHESLDASFPFHFAFRQHPRDVMVRMYYSRRTRSVWLVIGERRDDRSPPPGTG